MKRPDLLATKWGRMTAFFFLYLTEGIPQGFTSVAVATEMRRHGLGPQEIGAFVGSLYLPWGFKWAYGPFVDVLSSERFGRRRMWIVLAQLLMIATLLLALPVDFATQVKLFTSIILVHNVFAATQDVAIDALAVGSLEQEERGLANGLMFAGAYLGIGIGGSGVLFLTRWLPFSTTFFFVGGAILLVTLLVAVPLQERPSPVAAPALGSLGEVGRRIAGFGRDTIAAFTSSRGALLAVFFALLPTGPYALGLALQSNLAVELGLDNQQVASINLWSTVISAAGCVIGGQLSDVFGRRRSLAVYIAAMALPTLYLANVLQQRGWVMPVEVSSGHPPAPAELVSAFWLAALGYALFNGLMYGTSTALFMDVTSPLVAATQFTAYMALHNLVFTYTGWWQGHAAESLGYPKTLLIDAATGLLCLGLLPFIRAARKPDAAAGVP